MASPRVAMRAACGLALRRPRRSPISLAGSVERRRFVRGNGSAAAWRTAFRRPRSARSCTSERAVSGCTCQELARRSPTRYYGSRRRTGGQAQRSSRGGPTPIVLRPSLRRQATATGEDERGGLWLHEQLKGTEEGWPWVWVHNVCCTQYQRWYVFG